MTIPVTSLTNLFGNTAINTAAGVGGDSSKSFTKVMGNVTNGNQNETPNQKNQSTVRTDTKPKDTENVRMNQERVAKNDQNQSEALNQKVNSVDKGELKEDALNQINEKAEELISSIAEKLDVSEEEVIAAMEVLGMSNADLLNSEMLTQLVVTISGEEDMMSLVMDEELYGNLNELLQTADSIKTELAEAFGISMEELSHAINQVSDRMESNQGITDVIVDTDQTMENAEVQLDIDSESYKNQPVRNEEAAVDVSGKTPIQSEAELEKTSVKIEVAPESEETIEKPLESTIQQTGTQSKNTEQGYQESGHSFLQNITESAAAIAENANANATDTSFTNALYAQDTESIMKQMVDYMKLHVSANVSEMEIQLQPASLGTVNLNIASKNGAITAQFTAQSETVKEALESQVVQLRESLDERGIKVEAIEVTVASHEFERNLEQGEQEARDSEQTEATKKTGRRRIVLNQEVTEELDELDINELGEADRIQVELMQQRGNTMSLRA